MFLRPRLEPKLVNIGYTDEPIGEGLLVVDVGNNRMARLLVFGKDKIDGPHDAREHDEERCFGEVSTLAETTAPTKHVTK